MAKATAPLGARLIEAVDLAEKGDWEGAHRIAQDHEGDEHADWIHAVAHRMEGDLGNARYWYERCRRTLRPNRSRRREGNCARDRSGLTCAVTRTDRSNLRS